jgi:GTP cyclohydrolase III
MKKIDENNLKQNLERLSEIAAWFEDVEEIDIEEGIAKAKEAAGLIASAKKRLKDIENEFEEIKKEIKTAK